MQTSYTKALRNASPLFQILPHLVELFFRNFSLGEALAQDIHRLVRIHPLASAMAVMGMAEDASHDPDDQPDHDDPAGDMKDDLEGPESVIVVHHNKISRV